MLSRLLFAIAVQAVGVAMCFYSGQVWTVVPWTVMLGLSYLLVIRGVYKSKQW